MGDCCSKNNQQVPELTSNIETPQEQIPQPLAHNDYNEYIYENVTQQLKLLNSEDENIEVNQVNDDNPQLELKEYNLPDGSTFLGEIINDTINGYGERRYPDGLTYKGKWRNNFRCGQGVQEWPDGSKYDGYWFDDMIHGIGQLTQNDGSVYKGRFVDGKKEGHGIQKYSDDSEYEGFWKDDLYFGEGALKDSKGVLTHGYWQNGTIQRSVNVPKIDVKFDEDFNFND